jgi:hypothetical protein
LLAVLALHWRFNSKKKMENKLETDLEEQAIWVESCLYGLFVGDSLGSISEFKIPWNVTEECIKKYPPWPSRIYYS